MLIEFGVNGVSSLSYGACDGGRECGVLSSSWDNVRNESARGRHSQSGRRLLAYLLERCGDSPGAVPRRLSKRVPRRGVVYLVSTVAWNTLDEAVEHRSQGCGVGAGGGVF